MKKLIQYINDFRWGQEPMIVEMATISKQEHWGNHLYRIATHGTLSGDREVPHIHIYLSNDKKPYNEFNFEISIVDILCYDEINLIYQRDSLKNILRKNRNKCSWDGYRKIKEGFEEWLFEKTKIPGDYIDNLDSLIYWYNQESENSNVENPLLDYIEKRGMKILDKYKKYFN